jgi:hypothetical protein
VPETAWLLQKNSGPFGRMETTCIPKKLKPGVRAGFRFYYGLKVQVKLIE